MYLCIQTVEIKGLLRDIQLCNVRTEFHLMYVVLC